MRKVEICGVNTAKLPLLTNEEMRELFALAQSGDKPARDKLVQGNLRLVLSIVQRFGNRGENPDDLFQVGCIGLVEPKIQEIAERLSLPASQVVFALDAIAEPVSLFEPIYNDGGDPIYVVDQVKDERENDQRWTEELSISTALGCLNEREQRIINLRFFVGKTQMEVADEIGISQAQVSRLEKNALLHLRKYV